MICLFVKCDCDNIFTNDIWNEQQWTFEMNNIEMNNNLPNLFLQNKHGHVLYIDIQPWTLPVHKCCQNTYLQI